jgi:hypothetical protein
MHHFNMSGSSRLHNIKRIVLYMASIFNNQFNINENNNQLLVANVLYTLSPGNYTPSSFVSAMNALIPTFVFIQANNKLSIQNPSGSPITITSDKTDARSSMSDYIGLDGDLTIAAGATIETQGVLDLSGLKSVIIHSPELFPHATISSSHGDGDISQTHSYGPQVPITQSFGFRTMYQPQSQELGSFNFDTARDIRTISIRLLDGDNEKPIVNRAAPWSLTFRAYY